MFNKEEKNFFWFLFLSATLVYIIGLFTDVMDIDAAQYASLTKQMMDSGNYLQFFYCGQPYLDKPPLLFWIVSISYKILGISNFSYKLPSFLFTLLGTYSTYRLGKLLYDQRIGVIAALVLYTSQGFFMFNSDVRTDAALAAAVIFATWQLMEYVSGRKLIFLLGGTVGVALAMLAKGPIGFAIPVIAVFSDLILKKRWKEIFNWHWLFAIVLLFAILSPMLYGLHEQYGNYGLKFYFWIQSFGRITGASEWNNGNDYTFFLHTFLWSFLPWSLIATFAVANFVYRFFKKSSTYPIKEYACIMGSVIPLFALSFSHYKLPHYIFPTFPLFAILSAEIITRYSSSGKTKALKGVQYFVLTISLITTVVFFFIFPASSIAIAVLLVAFALLAFLFFRYRSFRKDLIYFSAGGSIFVNLVMNIHFYPELLKYQSSHAIANYIRSQYIDPDKILSLHEGTPSFDFYLGHVCKGIDYDALKSGKYYDGYWLYTNRNGLKELREKGIQPKQIISFPHFAVSLLTPQFLNPSTRHLALEEKLLVEL